MDELVLPQDQVLALRARAHGIAPLVLLGNAGLSDAVVREIDRALNAHGLVKVRAGRIEREAREALYLDIATRLGAARIQVIGGMLVFYRPPAPKPAAEAAARPTKKSAARAPAARTPRGRSPQR
jgi:putative YhbY family RNA-binding protein